MSNVLQPGTPGYRFVSLVAELEKRFPHPKPWDSTKTPEAYALEAVDRLIAAHEDLVKSKGQPGDSLEDNVKYLLDNCPFAVRDFSGERTGNRAKEDLAGSLAITFLGMQNDLKKIKS